MKNEDVALIQRILAGDENAFESLIRKYQKQVHAQALRQIGDFQIAEDIVQETFVQVYQQLETLEDPKLFPKWLYVIVNRRCIAWLRKNRLQTQSLEETDISEIETEAYSQYVAEEHAKTTAEAQRDLVKKLLAKLKESDREVITLHYFEEMSSSEIGEFLGVSENTIKSRLRRARQRLKKYEFMIQETLDITIEAGHRSQNQLKGTINMTDEVRDNTEVEANAEETQRQIANLQQQIKVIAAESDAFLASRRNEALETLRRVPYDAERPISWGYVGGYRTSPGKVSGRVAFWSDNIDNFLSKAPDADIVNLASLFTNPTIIAVLRQLVEGKRSVSDLAKGCGLPESEIEKAVETLMDATLVERTEEDLIEPKNDAVSFFLNFVSMTIVHLGHIKLEN
ncbi:MAG: sigma-70 family RNA polymerase sigma factor [Candidatus Poribacteria bacterium]|nr:sigma-70 family RNA polymerase sigma factor [Candidatus Poribacteria bacterium]